MSTDRQQRLARMFGEAIRLEGDAREAYLRDACGDDEKLLADVRSLIQHDENAGDFLAAPASQSPDAQATAPAAHAGPPSPLDAGKPAGRDEPTHQHIHIEGYQITRELSRGGQGVVYQAIQKATKRKVAIKVMREGPFAGRGERARFEREIEILGQLRHPNIVAVHDSGTASGCFYYVMDYISGQPLDVWMSQKERGINDALKLFAKICEAINAAHLKGIIHRDLKPGNIRIDDSGEPHILDFGLAKVAQGAEELSLMTMTGQFMGSLPWASPEQAEAKPGLIDTRTDVYSLGVILYQMLTGKFPYEVVGNMRDVLDRILKAEPVKPSTIRRQINDEVETIVLKCLSKERERRYQTAGELSRDIAHYLVGEPIDAKRDSGWYVLRKNLRRNWGSVVAAAAVFAALAVGLTGTTWQWRRADDEAKKAWKARENEAEARRVAEKKSEEAEAARKTAEEKTAESEAAARATQAALQRVEQLIYAKNITLAQAAVDSQHYASALKLLYECPGPLRGWEWGWLFSVADNSVAELVGHKGQVFCASFSKDGKWIVTGSADNTARVWSTVTGEVVLELRGHTRGIRAASFSSDSRRIVTASEDGTARVWDIASGAALGELKGHSDKVWSAEFSPDGTRIVTASGDHTARIWDSVTFTQSAAIVAHEDQVCDASFSPDGLCIVTASADKMAGVWNAVTGEALVPLSGHTNAVRSASFSPDGIRIATGSDDSEGRVWNAITGQCLVTLTGHRGPVRSAYFSNDGIHIVTSSCDATGRIWDALTGELIVELKGSLNGLSSTSYSPSGALVVGASLDHRALLWNTTASPSVVLSSDQGSRPPWDDVSLFRGAPVFSPNGSLLLTGGDNASVWNTSTGSLVAKLVDGVWQESIGSFSPDGQRLASISARNAACIWDTATGRRLLTLGPPTSAYTSASFNLDGTRVLTTELGKNAAVWDAATGRLLFECEGRVAAFSPDGTRLVTSLSDDTIGLWDATTGVSLSKIQPMSPLPAPSARLIMFSPDGTRIVRITNEYLAQVWDLVQQTLLFTIDCKTIEYDAELLPALESLNSDGTLIVTPSADSIVRVRNAWTGVCVVELRGHEASVRSASFSPDGDRIVTASNDKSVRVWDTETGQCLITLRETTSGMVFAAFSPSDGAQIVTVSTQGTVRIWDSVPYSIRNPNELKPGRGKYSQATVASWLAARNAAHPQYYSSPIDELDCVDTYEQPFKGMSDIVTLMRALTITADNVKQAGSSSEPQSGNEIPVADAGPDQIRVEEGNGVAHVDLFGAGSFDPDGQIIAYTWKVDGGATHGPNPTPFVALSLPVGTWTVTLTVMDNKGAKNSDSVCVLVRSRDALEVSLPIEFVSNGIGGGPFAPCVQAYTLVNMGNTALKWSARVPTSWIAMSSTEGVIEVGSATTVTVSINAQACSFLPGKYDTTVTFTNVNSGMATRRDVRLYVAPISSMTVSKNARLNIDPEESPDTADRD